MTQNQSPGWRRHSSSGSLCSVIIIFCLAAFYSLMCFQIHHQITIVEILLPFEGLSADVSSCGLFLTLCDHVMLFCFRRGRNWVPVKDEEWGYYIVEWDVASMIFFKQYICGSFFQIFLFCAPLPSWCPSVTFSGSQSSLWVTVTVKSAAWF